MFGCFVLFFALWFTCNSVEGGDHQHEDRGQVQVPAQTHLDEQGPGVEVRLGREQGDIRREKPGRGSAPQVMEELRSVSHRDLGEDGQQQREDSQVRPDPLPSETAAQVLRHGHDLGTHSRISSGGRSTGFLRAQCEMPVSERLSQHPGAEMRLQNQTADGMWLM